MAKKKQFASAPALLESLLLARQGSATNNEPAGDRHRADQIVRFPAEGNASSRRSFDFGKWNGRGIEKIVNSFQTYIEHLLRTGNGGRSTATIAAFCSFGYVGFFNYCELHRQSLQRDLEVDDLGRDLIDGFLVYLSQSNLKSSTQRSRYTIIKSTLHGLASLKLLTLATGESGTFPPNPFPFAHRHVGGARALSIAERKAFTAALKTELQQLYVKGARPTADLLSFAVLAVALRTGRNTTPLLELTPECLRPHPKANMRILVCYKRRGETTHKIPQRTTDEVLDAAAVLPDVVRLIERAKALCQPMATEAPPHLANRLWLFRTRRGGIATIDDHMLGSAVAKLVQRHNLRDADGKPLRVTITRLRKTFGNRVFEILDGDVAATARALGNSVAVADRNYLAPGPEAATKWRFMGQTLAQELQDGALLGKQTPTARCSDPLNGQLAPKNVAQCTNFLACLRCRNVVITNDADDLHRLFSFYWLVVKERARMDKTKWRRHYAQVVRLIERDVVDAGIASGKLGKKEIEVAKARALETPHPYWSAADLLEQMA